MNIRFSQIKLEYPLKKVLRGVSVEFSERKIHALLGENGAGKSTLMKILTGSLSPDSGEIYLDSRKVVFNSPSDSLKEKIACVYQRPFLCDSLSVKENLEIGIKGRISRELPGFLSETDPELKASKLSGDMRFFTAFEACLLRHPKALVLDEPTALLSDSQTEKLFERLRFLAGEGMNIIVITHKARDLSFCDDTVFLEDGMTVTKKPDFSETAFETGMFEKAPEGLFPLTPYKCRVLRKDGAGIIPSDKTYLGSDPALTVTELLCASVKGTPEELKKHTLDLIQKAAVNTRPEDKAGSLSGGMLQRLILERELALNPKVLYLEDPFQGLDADSAAKLMERLVLCKKAGTRIIL